MSPCRAFAELCKINAQYDPNKACNELNTIAQHYQLNIWRERGNIPRWVLPGEAAPAMQRRVAAAQAQLAARARNSLEVTQMVDESTQRIRDIEIWNTYRIEYCKC